ncbi:MAG: sigma 54-interacting transcriptional regulator [Deltaproteobacteria bacterium]
MSRDDKTVKKKSLARPKPRRRVVRIVYAPDPAARGRVVELDGREKTFGRAAEGDGLVEDDTMSRQHFALRPEAGAQYRIEDLGTSNGTFVDGRQLSGPAPVEPQQVIAAGETLFTIDVEPKKDTLPATDVDADAVTEVVGVSLATERLRRSLATVARAPGAVLLLGATGAGKEVAANAIHRLSERPGGLVAVNCAAIPKDMAEAELFGHVRGAYTGAETDRAGYIDRADGGTLVLDEIGDLPEALQAKLLRVLETGEVARLGAEGSKKVDVRFIGATHKDLEGGAFRKDLFARLSDWVLRLPPLKDRKADVLPLFDHFLGDAESYGPEVAEALLLHDWPMNVRELRKLAQRLRTLADSGVVALDDLPSTLTERLAHRFEEEVEDPDDPNIAAPPREELEAALRACKGNVKDTAAANGWHRTQLYRWLKRRAIDPKAFRDG